MKRWLLVDGNSLVTYLWFRSASVGVDEDELVGQELWLYIGHLVNEFELSRVAVAWDDTAGKNGERVCRRRQMYERYKKLRVVPPEWAKVKTKVLAQAKESLKMLPVVMGCLPRLEADDLVWCWSRVRDGVIVSGDKDLWQCADRRQLQIWSPRDKRVVDSETIEKEFGSVQAMMVQKAMIGDVNDCVEGVSGIGKARAKKLWSEHEQELLRMLDGEEPMGEDDTSDKWFKTVKDQCEVLRRNWRLMRLGQLIAEKEMKIAEALLDLPVKFKSDDARHHAAYMGWHEVIKRWTMLQKTFQTVTPQTNET